MSTTIILYITVFLLVLTLAWIVRTEMRLRVFFRGKQAKSLEDTITALAKTLDRIKEREDMIIAHSEEIDVKLKESVRGVSTLRFNPFADSGSNQSFAVCLLNELGDGVVISSLYSRERVSVFAKPIEKLASIYELSAEEKQVFEEAKKKVA